MFHNDNFVITGNCRVLWDGITRPEALDGGGFKHSIKVAQLASSPENGELQVILDRELQNGEFRGVLPPGGLPGMGDIRGGEYGDMIPGHKVFNTVTFNGAPEVFDINGQKLDPAHYGSMLYPGATVQLIVSARSYNNKSKGLGFWLNGIKIIDATTPKLPVGGGAVDAGAAFASAPAGVGSAPVSGATPQTAVVAPSAAPVMAAPVASVAPAPAGSPPAPVAPAPDFLMVNGQQFTAEQLRGANWTEEQINAQR